MPLYSRVSSDIGLQEAVDQCSEIVPRDSSIALLYTPSWCGFAQAGTSADDWYVPASKDRSYKLDSVFEARIFSEQGELRWLKQSSNKGHAALISELDISRYLAADAGIFGYEKSLDQTYLLWGEGAAANDLRAGWSRLAMARIGTMNVPYAGVNTKGQRIQLLAREYLDVIDDYGNVAVVEERLLKLAGA